MAPASLERWLITAAIVVGLVLLHLLASWAEQRGWIYYRKRRGASGALANAALEVQAILEPATRHVIEERQEEPGEPEAAGDPPPGCASSKL